VIPRRRLIAVIGVLAVAGACEPAGRPEVASADSALLAGREARLEQKLAHPDSDGTAPLARWELPEPLKEISGLAIDAKGRLLAHGDSRGQIVEVDYRRGTVPSEFTLGTPVAHGDFDLIIERLATQMSAPLELRAASRLLNQDPAHRFGRGGEEMPATVPRLRVLAASVRSFPPGG